MMPLLVHVMHARPIMTVGVATALSSADWRVTTHAERPDGIETADIVVADYDTGLAVARARPHGARMRKVLVVTDRDKEADVLRASEASVAGYLLEDAGTIELRHAVWRVVSGTRYYSPSVAAQIEASRRREHLTGRETDVLQLLAGGRCDKQIARDLGIGVGTVRWHLRNLMGKLGVSARLHAVVVAAQRGIVRIDHIAG